MRSQLSRHRRDNLLPCPPSRKIADRLRSSPKLAALWIAGIHGNRR
jgi:hypothetical protein